MDPASVTGQLTVTASGFVLPNPAIIVHDYGFAQLLDITLSGDNVETIAGHVAYPRVIKQQTATIPILIDTTVDANGDATADPMTGLIENLELIQSELLLPTTEDDGAQEVQFEPVLGGPVRTGRVQFVGVQVGQRSRRGWLAVLDLVLPDGPLTEGS